MPRIMMMLGIAVILRAQSAPRDAQAYLRIGVQYTEQRDFLNAAEYFRKALALDPELIPARKNLGTVLWFLNRKQESVREFSEVLTHRPDDPVPHLYLGLAACEAKRFASARAHFEKAGPLALENPEVLPSVVQTFKETRDTAGLEKLAAANPTSQAVRLALGDVYDRVNQPEKAYAAYRAAVESNATSEQGYIALAHFASAHANNNYALKVIAEGLRRLPGSARLLLEEGLLHALGGDRARSEESFVRAAAADPRSDVPLLALGVSLLERGEPAAAAARFRDAARVDPQDYRAEYLYATALGRLPDRNDPKLAEAGTAALRRAIALNPADANSHAALGKAYVSAGRLDLAVPELRRALELDSGNPVALYQLGLASQKLGRTEEARALFERFRAAKAKSRDEGGAAVLILRVMDGKGSLPRE